jgi:DUF971 family protein
MTPKELWRLADGSALSVTWDNGEVSRLDASVLRRNSRSASARRALLDREQPPVSEDIRLTDLRLVGAYGVQLIFSDGHDRGIYPWSYLRQLADAAE